MAGAWVVDKQMMEMHCYRPDLWEARVKRIMEQLHRFYPQPLPQDSSNTALFEMMMHYKQEADAAMLQVEHAKYRARELQEMVLELTEANARGAIMINQKHQAGVVLLACSDRLSQLCGDMRHRGVNIEPWAQEIEFVMLRADAAAHILHDINLDANEVIDLTDGDEVETVIDLTGEETDEEMTEESSLEDVDIRGG